tara:strand:+ start:204 stop:551 length:348 start_codon:yes stop_codon:yes gene_type:complete
MARFSRRVLSTITSSIITLSFCRTNCATVTVAANAAILLANKRLATFILLPPRYYFYVFLCIFVSSNVAELSVARKYATAKFTHFAFPVLQGASARAPKKEGFTVRIFGCSLMSH